VTVCIVDTSILDELLNVPGRSSQYAETVAAFEARQEEPQRFLLPIAVLIETGNHVAQAPTGDARRKIAKLFVEFARRALTGDSPFVPTPVPTGEELLGWLDDFPDRAMSGVGMADRSLIALWEAQRDLQPQRRVYIWTLDAHLVSYDTGELH
jgi:hypothetical protein